MKEMSSNQMLLVSHTRGSSAIAEFYVRNDRGQAELIFRGDALIGKCGVGKERESDGKTPLGEFGIRTAFGIRENPGTKLPYIRVKDTTYACDEDCKYYNLIIDSEETGHACKGEHMIEYSKAYAYGMATDYNPSNVYPLGSAIFIHCKGDKPWTAGCIALDEDLMKTLLRMAEEDLKVVIR